MVGWTTPLQESTGMMIRLVVEENSTAATTYLVQGDFAMGTSDMGDASRTAGEMASATRDLGPIDRRIVYPHGSGGRGYAVRGDSGIVTPHDIKPGMKYCHITWVPNALTEQLPALLAWGQVDMDDIVLVPVGGIPATSRMVMEGQADITHGYPASPQWIENEASPHGLAWIKLDPAADPEGAERFLEIDGGAAFGKITNSSTPSGLGAPSIVTIPSIVAMADQDTEFIYNLVKWFDENYETFKDNHPYCKGMTLSNLMNLAEVEFVALHDGAVKYLEEKGLWTSDHEKRRQQNIALQQRYVDAYQEALYLADSSGIKVDPANEVWIELWEKYKRELGLPKFRLHTTFP